METQMMSLFDYLGKAAGKELGAQVANAAARQSITTVLRYVSTETYTGNVNLYPKSFLDSYFDSESIIDNSELPF
jgi:hypothetical protein